MKYSEERPPQVKDYVRAIAGKFKGYHGDVVEVDLSRGIVKVWPRMFVSGPVEVPIWDLEQIEPEPS